MIPRNYGELTTYDTRKEAHEKVDKELRRRQILDVLEVSPMTAKEVAVVLYHQKKIPTPERNFTAPRITEMMNDGIVEPIGKKKCQWTGKTVSVFAIRG